MKRCLFTFVLMMQTVAMAAGKSSAMAEACAKKCPSYQNTEVCFIGKSTEIGIGRILNPVTHKLLQPGSCQGIADQRIINDPSEIPQELAKILNSCKRVSRMVLFAHSSSNLMNMGTIGKNILIVDWKNLDPQMSCAFADHANIDLRGCNIGKGCDGQKQMYEIAKAFLGDKPGRLSAPTELAASDRINFAKARSVNGKDRTLIYSGKRSDVVFGYEGLLLSTPEAHQVCVDDLKAIKARFEQLEAVMIRKKCSVDLGAWRRALNDLETYFSNSKFTMLPGDGYLHLLETGLEKVFAQAIQICRVNDFRESIMKSDRPEDKEYLRLLETPEPKEAPASGATPRSSPSGATR